VVTVSRSNRLRRSFDSSKWLACVPLWLTVLLGGCGGKDTASAPALRQARDPWVSPVAGCVDDGSDLQLAAGMQGPRRVSLAGLLSEMVDLTALTRWPEPSYTSQFVSSHDSASDVAESDQPEWFANLDFIALEADQSATLLEAQGAGTLVRFWSASPAGVVRIYIDGAPQPAIEAPLQELLSGKVQPFGSPFAFVAAGGHNLYFPIPFASSCRITLTGPAPAVYYHVSYRRYEPGTDVEPFGPSALRASECVRTLVGERLAALEPSSGAVEGAEARSFQLRTDAPEEPAVIQAADAGSMLWQLRIWPSDTSPAALRETLLSIGFDGHENVRVPLGDFFASGISMRNINSVPIGVEPAVLTARWPMPFERVARIALEATGVGQLDAMLEVMWGPATWTDRSLHFHAQWRPPATISPQPPSDWSLALLEGKGLYVGNAINVINRTPDWWGEGDEKIYVDGERFPSHFGTGTEDYFGYAYCSNQTFSSSYIGQPVASLRQNFGYVSAHRFLVLDPIPFRTGLRFDLEVLHWGESAEMTYDAVSFWYARPGSRMLGAPAIASSNSAPSRVAARPSTCKIMPPTTTVSRPRRVRNTVTRWASV
jgi:hypothetical protein